MIRSDKNFDWLTEKYGAYMRPWEYHVTLDNTSWTAENKAGSREILYTYSLRNDLVKVDQFEEN